MDCVNIYRSPNMSPGHLSTMQPCYAFPVPTSCHCSQVASVRVAKPKRTLGRVSKCHLHIKGIDRCPLLNTCGTTSGPHAVSDFGLPYTEEHGHTGAIPVEGLHCAPGTGAHHGPGEAERAGLIQFGQDSFIFLQFHNFEH